jgi:hypothetical protein
VGDDEKDAVAQQPFQCLLDVQLREPRGGVGG